MNDEIIPNLNRKKHSRLAWIKRFLQHGPQCHYCKLRLTLDTAVKEHLIPICRGGADSMENIVPACEDCNDMKAWRTADEFVRDREMLLSRRTIARTKTPPSATLLSLEEANEPGLLKKLTLERESQSHWWRSA